MPDTLTTDQRKAELKKFWYQTSQVEGLKRHYLGNLRGVEVKPCAENYGELRENITLGKADVVNFGYRIVSKRDPQHPEKEDAHLIDITIAKDKTNPGKVLVLAQDPEGRPIPRQIRDIIENGLGRKYGAGNVHFVDCSVEQQKNNIDCGPLSVINGVDNVASVLACYKSGKSIIEAVAEENGLYFQNRLLIQEPQNLTKLRQEHAAILGAGKNKGIPIQGAVGEAEELKAGPDPFDYKRKKPLSQSDDFKDFYQEPQEVSQKTEKKRPFSFTNPADRVASKITAAFDAIIYGLGLEKKPKKETPTAKKAAAGGKSTDHDEREVSPSADTISPDLQKQAEELAQGNLQPPSGNATDARVQPRALAQTTVRGGRD